MVNYISLFIDNKKLTIIKKYNQIIILILFNNNYFMFSEFDKYNIRIDCFNSILIIKQRGLKNIILNESKIKLYQKLLNCCIISWEIWFFEKISFTGKGYKIKRPKSYKGLKLFFGHSHLFQYSPISILLKKLYKAKYIFLSKNKKILNSLTKKLTSYRNLNCYTKRGLRTRRRIVFKRTGKKANK